MEEVTRLQYVLRSADYYLPHLIPLGASLIKQTLSLHRSALFQYLADVKPQAITANSELCTRNSEKGSEKNLIHE